MGVDNVPGAVLSEGNKKKNSATMDKTTYLPSSPHLTHTHPSTSTTHMNNILLPLLLSVQFAKLKGLLESRGYSQHLDITSGPLAERLISDLVSAERTLETAVHKAEQAAKANSVWQGQLDPLRKENARLIRENNQLHLAIIKDSEESQKQRKCQLEK